MELRPRTKNRVFFQITALIGLLGTEFSIQNFFSILYDDQIDYQSEFQTLIRKRL